MRSKVLFLLVLLSAISFQVDAQRAIRIGYIDTEYILENVPEYQEASSQLESKVSQWKTDIETRLSKVQQKKDQLNTERVLLTQELVDERQEEIDAEEAEILDYQQKRFGPNGDLMIQKQSLIQPIQDQIFAAVQQIAGTKKYDFIFDKSADVVMLYSAERFDISEQVLRAITRSSKREQAQSRRERKAAEEEEIIPEINEEKEARDQAIADKKAEREKAIADRRAKQLADREAKKKEIEERKKKILEDRKKAREEKLRKRGIEVESEKEESTKTIDSMSSEKGMASEKKDSTASKVIEKDPAAPPPAPAKKELSDREKRKKALEDKKKRILEARKKAREEKLKKKQEKDSTDN
ncbi:MAG: OmpH family outer membrane protein [bacterium]